MSRDESPSDDDIYNNAHRAFLQAFLSRSVMTADEIKPVLAAVMTAHEPTRPRLPGDITSPDITSFIQTVNARLEELDYEIRSTISQTSKDTLYVLVNTQSDALTQLATTFSPDEIAYIKRLLDAMFETNNTRSREIMAVKKLEATQLARAPRNRQSQAQDSEDDDNREATQRQESVKGLTIPDAERILSALVAQKFFAKRGEYYSLAPRALTELRAYLKETYNEPPDPDDPEYVPVTRIRDCNGCTEIVTVGQRCANRECGCRLHDHCLAQFFRGRAERDRRCPVCKTAWTGDAFVGERAARQQGSRRTTAGDRRNQVFDDDDDDE